MARNLPTDSADNGGIDGNGFRSGGGKGNQRPQVVRPPGPPRSASLTVYSNGTWQAKWQDVRIPQGADDTFDPPDWIVGFCPDAAAGPASNNLSWARDVRDKAKVLGDVASNGRGQMLSWSQGDVSSGDGWVVIWGENVSGKKGEPCHPMHDVVSLTTGAIPNDPQPGGVTADRFVRKVHYEDNAGSNVYEFVHTIKWKPPATQLTEFAGMQMYRTGVNGTADLIETSSMCPWNGTTGVNTYSFITPEDEGVTSHKNTVATFTHGSANLVWVSGDHFSSANNGKWVVVYGASADDEVAVYTAHQLSSANSTHMVLDAAFTGTTGNYSMRIYNTWTYYLVGVSVSGLRRGDPASSTAFFSL